MKFPSPTQETFDLPYNTLPRDQISPPNAAEIIAALPPIDYIKPANDDDDAEADAHNAAVLAISTSSPRRRSTTSPIATTPTITFTPFYFFFYGSLQIPEVLHAVCDMPEGSPELILRSGASIKDWKVRMWGPFPALVPAFKEDDAVEGVVWLCESPEHVASLCHYETDMYRIAYCDVTLPKENGDGEEVIENARMFVSTFKPDELGPGEFDKEAYLKRRGW
ncbi:hypothetical protein RRF57_003481 [Xylaria bambusicola]|uniref:Gamma-glutamylcyclotransferase AIG2-like domain-containing protein n=1 Tax=Xylaria bambusicola TaxID=326684 RepID=A0AAN7UKA8_9PEZI